MEVYDIVMHLKRQSDGWYDMGMIRAGTAVVEWSKRDCTPGLVTVKCTGKSTTAAAAAS